MTEEQRAFVADYYMVYEHYPMFYNLWRYLSVSKDRSDIIFAMSTGMLDGHCKTLEEIGEYFDLTRERIRQILVKTSKKLFEDKDWGKYPFMCLDRITRDNELFLDVVNKERVDLSFESFAQICFRGLHFKIVNEKGSAFLRK